MNRAQLRAFHAVAVHGGFSAAARAIGLTQPALTHQVRALESAHGVTLFHRQGHRVILSDAGCALLPLVKRILALEEEADTLLAEAGGLRRGTLRVAADGPYHLIPILSRMKAHHPALELSVTVGNSATVERSLLELACDVAVLAQVTDDARLYALPISRHPVVVFVSRADPLARRRSVALAELHQRPMVIRERGSTTRRVFEEAALRAGVCPRVALEIESREAVREAVAAGMGFGVVSAPEVGYDERVVLLPIGDVEIFTEEQVVCLEERRKSRAIAAFLELARVPSATVRSPARPRR